MKLSRFSHAPNIFLLIIGIFFCAILPLKAPPDVGDPDLGVDNRQVSTHVVDLEEKAGPWMYGKRKGDPLALPMADPGVPGGKDVDPMSTRLKLFFRERKIAAKSAVDPSGGRDIKIAAGNNQTPANARERATMLAVSRYRELPLDEMGGTIDLTNVLKNQNPKNKDGKSFYFVPLGRSGAQQLKADSAIIWEEAPAPAPKSDDILLHYSQDLPWDIARPGTLMNYASEKVQEVSVANPNKPEDSGVVFASWDSGAVKIQTGGEFRRVQTLYKNYFAKVKQMVVDHAYDLPSLSLLEGYGNQPGFTTGDESLGIEINKLETWISQQPPDKAYSAHNFQLDRMKKQRELIQGNIMPWNISKSVPGIMGSFDDAKNKAFTVKPGGVVLDLRYVVPYQGEPRTMDVDSQLQVAILLDHPELLANALIERIQKKFDDVVYVTVNDMQPEGSEAYKTAMEQSLYYPPEQPDIYRKPLLIAYHGQGHGPLIIRGGAILSGPIQVVTDQPMILVGNMGASDPFNNPVIKQKLKEIYNWMKSGNDARWRLIAPEFQIASTSSASQVESGKYGPLPGPSYQPDLDTLKARLANAQKQKKAKEDFLTNVMEPLAKELQDGGFNSIQDAINKKNALQAKEQNDSLSDAEKATLARAIALEAKTQGASPLYSPTFIPRTLAQIQQTIQDLKEDIQKLEQRIADLKQQIAAAQN